MKTIEIEGVRLTKSMLEILASLQEDNGTGITGYLDVVDRSIRFIAVSAGEHACDKGKIEAFNLIADLALFGQFLRNFTGKEDDDE